jgi:hypothetical protein
MCGGLNGRLHRDALRELVTAERPSIGCVQETKLAVLNDFDVIQCLGPGFDYFFLPAVQTRGGILLEWRSDTGRLRTLPCALSQSRLGCNRSMARVRPGGSRVYGPSTGNLKQAFLEELHELSQVCVGAWLLTDDFNMIYRVEDKNNDRLNRRPMGQFRSFLNTAQP